jgi:hypothetical protein
MDTKDRRIAKAKITLILFNAANALILGMAIGKLFGMKLPNMNMWACLIASSVGLAVGVSLAFHIVWRDHAQRP